MNTAQCNLNRALFLSALAFLVLSFLLSCESREKKTSAEEYYRKSYQFIDAGYPREALELLNLAIEKDPSYFEAYHTRGVVHFLMKNYDMALSDFNRAITLQPDNSSPYVNRGSTYEKMKNMEMALVDYRKAARLGDKDAQDLLGSRNLSW